MSIRTNPAGKVNLELLSIQGLTQPLIDTYDNLVRNTINEIVSSNYVELGNRAIPEERQYLRFTDIKFVTPTMRAKDGTEFPKYPSYARINKESYMADIWANVQLYNYMVNREGKFELRPAEGEGNNINVKIGQIPILLGSIIDNSTYKPVIIDGERSITKLTREERYQVGEANYDPQCYFIIDGREISIVNFEKLRLSHPMIYKKKDRYIMNYTFIINSASDMMNISANKDNIIVAHLSFFGSMDSEESGVNVFIFLYLLLYRFETDWSDGIIETIFKRLQKFIPSEDETIPQKFRKQMKTSQMQKFRVLLAETANNFKNIIDKGSDPNDPNTIFEERLRKIAGAKGANMSFVTSSDKEVFLFRVVQSIFPNVVIDQTKKITPEEEITIFKRKFNGLAYLVVEYIMFLSGERGVDDRDSWFLKRLAPVEEPIRLEFIQAWKEYKLRFEKQNRTITNLKNANILHRESDLIGKHLIDSIRKGRPGNGKEFDESTIARDLNRSSLLHSFNQIRMTAVKSAGKGDRLSIRYIKPTQYGGIDFLRTPEGKRCGEVNELTLNSIISLEHSPMYIEKVLIPGVDYFTEKGSKSNGSILLNGVHIGFGDSFALREKLRIFRFQGKIPIDTGLIMNKQKDLFIYVTQGRLVRPLLVVEDGELVLDKKCMRNNTINEMISAGVIEYMDIAEQALPFNLIAENKNKLIELNEEIKKIKDRYERRDLLPNPTEAIENYERSKKFLRYTHMEIDEINTLGLTTNSLTFIAYQPGIRTTYTTSMEMQGIIGNVFRNELYYRTTHKELISPGIQGVTSEISEALVGDRTAGHSVIVFVMPLTGFEQEDAILLNKGAVERGLFSTMVTWSEDVKITHNQIRGISKDIKNRDAFNVEAPTYVVKKGQYVNEGDVLVARYIKDSSGKEIDKSKRVGLRQSGIVSKVSETSFSGGTIIRIEIRELRKPTRGDKFSSRYGQKATAGQLVEQEDLPFYQNENGEVVYPDLIFNPHSIPGRMTVSQLMEILYGMVWLLTGERQNATFGKNIDINTVFKILEDLGFSDRGKIPVYSGRTGKKLEVPIYTGPIHYQVSKHQAKDKIQARSEGKYNMTNRQPPKGANKNGGQRVGEMESDALVAYGASQIVKERLNTSSDPYQMRICQECNLQLDLRKESPAECNFCGKTSVSVTDTTYANKILSTFQIAYYQKTEYGI